MSNSTPAHIGFILDGNRRWAQSNGLASYDGHTQGYEKLKDIAIYGFDRGVKFITAFVFSTENWQRESKEVKYLMNLALKVFERDIAELAKKNIRVRVLGTRENLSKKIVAAIERTESLTKNNTKANLTLCFNYGGREEILAAVKKIVNNHQIRPEQINEQLFRSYLYSAELPDPEMVIRTGGQKRLSNFLLWESAYTELMFVSKYWPDFNEADFDQALSDFSHRQRNFGS